TDCFMEFQVVGTATGTRMTCKDGDTSCDQDTTKGQCTIRLSACFNVQDPRNTACKPTAVTGVQLSKPQSSSTTGQGILNAISTQGPSQIVTGRRGGVTFQSAIAGTNQCTQPMDVVVPMKKGGKKKGRLVIKSTALTGAKGGKGKDRDTL